MSVASRASLSRAPSQGMSLVEILIAAGLLAMLGYLLAQIFTPMMRSSQHARQRIDLQQSGALALQRLVTDLGQTPPDAIMTQVQGTDGRFLFGVHPVRDIASDSRPNFASQLFVYIMDPRNGKLRRYAWPPANDLPPTGPRMLLPEGMAQAASQSQGRQMCEQVLEWQVSSSGNPVNVRLVLGQPAKAGRQELRVELERDVLLRN